MSLLLLCTCLGDWINALKEILKSVYGYFNYDIDSYIASELELQSASSKMEALRGQSSSDEHQSSDAEEECSDEQDESTEPVESVRGPYQGASEQLEIDTPISSVISNRVPVTISTQNS